MSLLFIYLFFCYANVYNSFIHNCKKLEKPTCSLSFFKKVIYLVVVGLSCSTRELQSLLKHAGSLVVAFQFLVSACGV